MSEERTKDHQERGPVLEYIMFWRNKYITTHCQSLDEMIGVFEGVVASFKAMQAKGVVLRDDGGVADDYATFVTTDAAVAKEFGFLPPDEDEDDCVDVDDDEWIGK